MKSLGLILILAACGGGGSGNVDGAVDSPKLADAHNTADAGGTQLLLKNYLAWCSVAINGAAASSASVQMVSVPPNSIPMVAAPANATFILGPAPWHHTAGDAGSGDPGSVANGMSTATVTVAAGTTKCVWICCPFTDGTGCPTADQCP